MKVYLAGPIGGLTWEQATEWRNDVSKQLRPHGIQCFSPLRGDNFVKDSKGILPWQFPENHNGIAYVKAILGRDHNDVQNCDMMLVNLVHCTRVSIGTMVEFGWASAYKKPIVTVMNLDNPHDHAFVTGLSALVTNDLQEAIRFTKYILLPDF